MSTSFAMSHSFTRSILERIELIFQVATSKAIKIYLLSYYHVNSDESLVLNQSTSFNRGQLLLALFFLTPIFISTGLDFFNLRLVKIADIKNYSIDDNRDIYSSFDSEDQVDQGLPIDPFDLMNRLKRAGAMSNATTPSDALDEALNAFDESEY